MNRLGMWGCCGVAVALAMGAHAGAPLPEIHACPDANGNVVYQDDECAVAAPAPVAKAAPKEKGTPVVHTASKPKPAPPVQRAPRSIAPVPAVRHASSRPAKGIKPVIDASVFTSDPRWGSPERTLHTFIAAMKDGDRAGARSCLTAAALDDFGPSVDSVAPAALRAMVDRYTGFVLEGQVGPYWSIRALRVNARPKWIFFERIPDGTWKISAI